jgi:hypothetical protein
MIISSLDKLNVRDRLVSVAIDFLERSPDPSAELVVLVDVAIRVVRYAVHFAKVRPLRHDRGQLGSGHHLPSKLLPPEDLELVEAHRSAAVCVQLLHGHVKLHIRQRLVKGLGQRGHLAAFERTASILCPNRRATSVLAGREQIKAHAGRGQCGARRVCA